jgi:hypothetical protein
MPKNDPKVWGGGVRLSLATAFALKMLNASPTTLQKNVQSAVCVPVFCKATFILYKSACPSRVWLTALWSESACRNAGDKAGGESCPTQGNPPPGSHRSFLPPPPHPEVPTRPLPHVSGQNPVEFGFRRPFWWWGEYQDNGTSCDAATLRKNLQHIFA